MAAEDRSAATRFPSCRELVAAHDWSATALGPREGWSRALQTTVGLLLSSRHPMFLWWGPSLVQMYNDAYAPSFGVGRHPSAMGQRGAECWRDIWPIIYPQIEQVMSRGEATWNEDHLVPIERNGRVEEVYWTYGYSPVLDDDGSIGGTLVVCTETTGRVVLDRRLQLYGTLSSRLLTAGPEIQRISSLLATALGEAPRDIPFALICNEGRLEHVIGLSRDEGEHVLATCSVGARRERKALARPLHAGPWPEQVDSAYVVPLEAPGEALVLGLSPRLPLDEPYRDFLDRVAEAYMGARSRARVETERRNLLLQAPVATALIVGPEHRFELANRLYCEMVGRDVTGQTYLEAFPELRDTPLPGILDAVYAEGKPFVTQELPVPIAAHAGGPPQERYFKFNLEPIRDGRGAVYGMMAVAADVTEQVKSRRELEATHQDRERLLLDAEAAARAKDEFLAMLGHELRNPLAPILTANQLLREKLGEPVPREVLILERQARHLVQLVDDLLDVARVAQGKIELRLARVLLADVVDRAVEIATPLFEKKGHTLQIELGDGLEVEGDVFRLSQVVANLLTNAARYTERAGHIAIRGWREAAEVVLSVEDDGIGIREDQLPRLFDAFFQAPRRRDRGEGGLGLGLAIVKAFTELHGGSVSARAAASGRGSVFELRLPASQASTSAPLSRDARRDAVRTTSPLRVLLVDDNEDATTLFAHYLQRRGHDVETAHDGPSCLDVVEAFHPDVAVLDIGLPIMDGYELATRLRELLGDATPRLIACTGYGQKTDRDESRRAGFALHLVKPVDPQALVDAVEEPQTAAP